MSDVMKIGSETVLKLELINYSSCTSILQHLDDATLLKVSVRRWRNDVNT